MSALGHKRTFCGAIIMSALPPKADMCSASTDVAKKLPILADSPENKRSPAKGQLKQFCRLLPLGQRRPTRAHGET
jgi:hypothetical protein